KYSGDTLSCSITSCRNEGQILAAPGKSSNLVMPSINNELHFFTQEELAAFEGEGKIVNGDSGITASVNRGMLSVVDSKFDLLAATEEVPNATRFELTFGFQGTGGLGGGGVTQYTFKFDSIESVENVDAYSWVNASKAAGQITAHNQYGTTYYTDEASHYVYNLSGYTMSKQPTVNFVAYDAEDNVLLINYYSYSD
ncbi:MAG: hypothetical protein ACI4NM_10145, partial [Bullifex sp.]